MRDWDAYVRAHLSVPGLTRDRESRVVRELASQLEDFYRDALARGLTSAEADAHARAQITDWTSLARTLVSADPARVRSPVDQWSERLDDRMRDRPGRWRLVADLWRDIRYAARRLRAQPVFTTVAVLTLGLGIGVNTAMFSIIHALLFDALPVERPGDLVLLNPTGPRYGWTTGNFSVSYPAYSGLRDRQEVFSGLIAERTDVVNLTIDGPTERATASIVSGNYFDVLGVRPLAGRLLSEADDRVRGGHPVAVLSYGFWVERLGMRPDVVGRDVRIGSRPFTIVGIAAKRFNGLEVGGAVDLFLPAMMLPDVVTYAKALDTRSFHIFNVYGRLDPSVGREQAEASLQPLYLAELEQDVVASGSTRQPADDWRTSRLLLEDGSRGTSALRQSLGTPLTAVMAMTIVLLVISAANIAGLQLARATAQVKEIAIRLAIGGSRRRIVRQVLTESAVLAGLGIAAAVWLAGVTIGVLIGEMDELAGRLQIVTSFLSIQVLAFAFALALVTVVIIGLIPAAVVTRPAIWNALRGGLVDIRGALRLRRGLVVVQLALSLVLMAASGLFGRTVYNLFHADTGFRTERLVQFQLNAGVAGYDRSKTAAAFRQVLEATRSLPGVEAASLSVAPLLDNGLLGFGLDIEGYKSPNGRRAGARGNAVAPAYFAMAGTPLLRGREFSEADAAGSHRVAIVSEAFVDRYLPNLDPIGRTIGVGYGGTERFQHEIVGVAKNARLNNLRDDFSPVFYLPYTQFDVLNSSFFLVRAAGDPNLLRRPIAELVRQHQPDLPVIGYVTIEDQIGRLLRPERLVASLSLALGVLATGLGAMGLYGVMAFSVARRTREIGLRMALGAGRAAVIRMVLRDMAVIAAIGIGIGTALALLLGRYVESQLHGVDSRDLATFAAAIGVLAVVVLASAWWPARRASRVDPTVALRED